MTDTINAGTIPIEEGVLWPQSLRFEGEPWGFFYRAGETIRELRKALVNEASAGAKERLRYDGGKGHKSSSR